MPDRALEEAAEAVKRKRFEVQRAIRAEPTFEEYAEAAVSAYLGALRRELPEHAVQAAEGVVLSEGFAIPPFDVTADALRAFLAALTGEGPDG